MPTSKLSRKRGVSEEYESDGGFVEDAPKSKKSKSGSNKASQSLEMKKDDENNVYWDISGKRRLQISEFKGNTMVGIREFYEKDGQMLPGKKGISLNLDQFNTFVELLPQIEGVLRSQGIKVARPQYSHKSVVETAATENEDEEPEPEPEPAAERASKSKGKLDKFRLKQNHEATSDEEEDE